VIKATDVSEDNDNLEKFRAEIDVIDQHLITLLNDRAKLVASVGEWKRKHNHPIYDPSREKLILEKVQKTNSGPLPNGIIAKIFSDLVSNFRQWELMSQELNDLSIQLDWLKTKRIGFIGIGLLGFSVILRFKKLCPAVKICGFDPGVIDSDKVTKIIEVKHSIEEVAASSDILILATPALVTIEILNKYESTFRHLELILDLASTKVSICQQAKSFKNFVGGHPLSGKSLSGADNAEPQLFVQRPFILCPNQDTTEDLLIAAEKIVAILGSIPYRVSAEFHDEMLGLTSHLPQMIATNLACMSSELYRLMGEPFLHGPAYSEMTRCASSNLKMWEDIVKTNKSNIINMVSKFAEQLSNFQNSLDKGDITSEFAEAKNFKNSFVKK
jgi:chorismate mutase-like protein